MDLGIVPDRIEDIVRALEQARSADVLLTLGGASVGKHDLVQDALRNIGIRLRFWRIAMRPGKPLMFARRHRQRIVGLPGKRGVYWGKGRERGRTPRFQRRGLPPGSSVKIQPLLPAMPWPTALPS